MAAWSSQLATDPPSPIDDAIDRRKHSIGRMPGHMSIDERAPVEVSSPEHSGTQFLMSRCHDQNSQIPLSVARRKRSSMASSSASSLVCMMLAVLLAVLVTPADAVLITNYENCLTTSTKNSKYLQFTPTFVDVVFNTTTPSYNLRVTVWGNVSGSTTGEPVSREEYNTPGSTEGRIVNNPDGTKLTTLASKFEFLSYTPWSKSTAFCDELSSGFACPLGPVFTGNATNESIYPSFQMNNNLMSSYSFASLTATILIINGDPSATNLGCISAPITPDLGSNISRILTFVPLVALISVAFATAFAGIFSPWGTTDVFRWTSNYGRGADLLRLVTPGFGDCLQYIQFVALTGGLTLVYPGYYQPVVSKVAWSALMFNQSFVSQEDGYQSLVDGIYVTNGKYGLNDMSQLVGMADVDDIWVGMAVWLLVILACVLAIIQSGFFIRLIYRKFSDTQEEDLRAKNIPFSVGNVIRIVFSYFLLPIVALSMFQLVEAGRSPVYMVALAAVLLLIVIVFAGWLLYVIASTRPRSYLFDDLPTVLLYGSLYNTYSDNAAPFALIPVLLTFVRGIAIGALTPSGIAQLVVLAICEVITILTLHAFRPFHSPTSMNAYHTVFAACRFISVLLMVAFAPSLGVTDGPKGWIGYAILLLHACVLVFGFMLNALQTIIEVAARLAGAGGEESGTTRGGLVKVFGMRQLSRRLPRHNAASRQSTLSTAAILEADQKSANMASGRIRSQSVGSNGILLDRPRSMGLDSAILMNGAATPTTPGGEASMFSFLPAAANPAPNRNSRTLLTLSNTEAAAAAADPYYRPPRARRPTMEGNLSLVARSRGSWASGDWTAKSVNFNGPTSPTDVPDIGPSISGRNTPLAPMSGYDSAANENRRSLTDYTTREVDFYYGVRGPALNANVPGRRLRTGPVDPTNNIASIGGFFKGLLGGKTKEKGKGFEVVRSSRMPPGMKARNVAGHESPPEGIPIAAGVARNGPIDSDDEDPTLSQPAISTTTQQPFTADEGHSPVGDETSDDEQFELTRISDVPPTIPDLVIDTGSGLGIPSRIGSRASAVPSRQGTGPRVPRKSSKRMSQNVSLTPSEAQRMMNPSTEAAEPPSPVSPIDDETHLNVPYYDIPAHISKGGSSYHRTSESVGSNSSQRLPFERTNSSKRQSTISTRSSILPPRSNEDEPTSGDVGRPTNVGHVHSRSVQTIYPRSRVDLLGNSAEIIDLNGEPTHIGEAR